MNRHLNTHQIVEKIKSENIDFISFSTTPWHLIGARAAYLQHCETNNNSGTPLFLITRHEENGYLNIEDTDIWYYEQDVRKSEKIRVISYLLKFLFCKKSQRQITIALPWCVSIEVCNELLYGISTNIKFVIFEEGIGSYKKDLYRFNYRLKIGVLHAVLFEVNKVLASMMKRSGSCIDICPMIYDGSKLVNNKNGVDLYKKVLHTPVISVNRRNVLIVSQFNTYIYSDCLIQICEYLVEKGYNIYVKEHPRYALAKEKFPKRVTWLVQSQPIEACVENLNIATVVGFDSTALLSLNYLYGIEPVSLINMIDYPNGDLKAWFTDVFSNIVKFPTSKYELIKNLNANEQI